ncbi:conjugal transfer protein TraS [Hafnia paralvei]|uniref:conjugal transfer protein TraS n=1 Tax=Hafnia paralvei TaxID=546367 RepID=UPI000FC29B3D|nr:conjugal transfer protein TraS [Hafnia paralvei]EHP5272771.1 conjugal transfer protein TraS [Escherichia coli]MCE9902119.1 conjugal transfer protein TraS [Hafnia paralvei]MCE9918920.1 conjugal transfer protein TraS [Hafnia paralvei]
MITHKIIQQETEELKQILKQGDLEVPSMWTCLWPGLVVALWLLVCLLLSFNSSLFVRDFKGFDILVPLAFCCFMGLMITLGTANARGTYLSVPSGFRQKSQLYAFFGKKIKQYALVYIVVMGGMPYLLLFLGLGLILYAFIGMFFTVIMGFILSIDISRYQLSMLSSVINACKSDSVSPTK